ncbi:MAG TPA: phospho-sugar mutase [Polyangiaceae bacterium]|nr:phospho-sugar mutase [Polyangiaceae bacterium]
MSVSPVNEIEERSVYARARAWADADPDPDTQRELRALIDGRATGELIERMGPELTFGTAGLRGRVEAGSARMNQAVVERTTWALAQHLISRVLDGRELSVVIGYDARPHSRRFARAAAEVLIGAGVRVRWFDRAQPTPMVAYVARVMGAAAAIVVTASHNPRGDNGFKVYGSDARQLDREDELAIEALRARFGEGHPVPRVSEGRLDARIEDVPDELFERYLAELDAYLPPRASNAAELKIAYTPVHGVGLLPTSSALSRRGFTTFNAVREQAMPDGTFPTTPFPNPEHPGTLALVTQLARELDADLILANDPDADRLAAGARLSGGEWGILSGNDLGVLLADFIFEYARPRRTPLFVTSIVSSPLLAELCRARGARVELTLTGFKWIWAAARALEAEGCEFVFGCEEALGYSVSPLVRDKDGVSAAVCLAELAARCRAQGSNLWGRLHGIYREFGVYASAQRSMVRTGLEGQREIGSLLETLTSQAPTELLGDSVSEIIDYRQGAETRPLWLGAASLVELKFASGTRLLARPSGTEPKLKIYADVRLGLSPRDSVSNVVSRARDRAEALANALADYMQERAGLPG